MYLFNNLLVFYFSYALIFFSIVGNGFFVSKFINCNNNNIFINFFLALPFLLLLGFSSYYLIGVSIILNIAILICGLFFFFKNIKLDKNFFYLIVFLLILYPGLIISKSHDDFTLYHFQYFKELVNFPIKIGIGNLDIRYSYSSMFTFIQTLFFFPYFNFNLFHVPSFLVFTSLIGYLFTTFDLKENLNLNFLKVVLSVFLLVKFSRISEFGYDFIGQFILILIFFLIIVKNQKDFFIIIYLFVFAFIIKANNLIFIFILLSLFNKSNFFYLLQNLKKNYFILLFSLLLFLSFILNNIFNSGCLLYFLTKTCFNNSLISWSLNPVDLNIFFNDVELWTKGFHKRIIDLQLKPEIYIKNFNWLKNWFLIHFFYKIFEFLLIFLTLSYLFLFLFIKKKNINFLYNKHFLSLFLFSFLSLFLWFIKIPQFRFGFSYILIFIMSFFLVFFNLKVNFSKKKYMFLFFLALFIFNFLNINRIYIHLKSNYDHKFEDFPWVNLKSRNSVKIITEYNFDYYKPEEPGSSCFNIKTMCSENNISVKYYKNYVILRKI